MLGCGAPTTYKKMVSAPTPRNSIPQKRVPKSPNAPIKTTIRATMIQAAAVAVIIQVHIVFPSFPSTAHTKRVTLFYTC